MTLTLPEGYEIYYAASGWGAVIHYLKEPSPPLGEFVAVGLNVGPITQEEIDFSVRRIQEIIKTTEG